MIPSRANCQSAPHLRAAAAGETRLAARPAPHFVLTHAGELLGEDTPETREIVRRIHACVAACEGISTEELEAGIVADMRRVIAEVVPVLQERVRR